MEKKTNQKIHLAKMASRPSKIEDLCYEEIVRMADELPPYPASLEKAGRHPLEIDYYTVTFPAYTGSGSSYNGWWDVSEYGGVNPVSGYLLQLYGGCGTYSYNSDNNHVDAYGVDTASHQYEVVRRGPSL